MVIGGGEGGHLGDAQVGEGLGVGGLVGGGVLDRSHPHDEALTGHEAGHRLLRADGAGVGEGDRGAGEVVGAQLVAANLADDLLVGGQESLEVEGVGVADARHDQRARAVGLLDVHGQAETDVVVTDDRRLSVLALEVRRVHHRHGVGDGADDRVADQVGERDLAAPGAAQVAVDHLTVDLEQAGRHLAEAGGRRYAEAGLHVGDDAGGRATDCLRLGVGGRVSRWCLAVRAPPRGGGRCGRNGGRLGRGGRHDGSGRGDRLGARRAVVGEELLPTGAHRGRVGAELLVDLVDEPFVRPHGR